jgi:hypothetical protein
MKAVLLSVFLLTLPLMAGANPSDKHCGKFSPTVVVSAPLTIRQIERQEMAELSEALKVRPDIPRVPFGFQNPEWLAFKSMYKPGDKIVRYSTDRHSWQHLAGETGFALIRSGCIISKLRTMMN